MSLDIVVLAAGQGKRMYSQLPKVLHEIGGRPMLGHLIDTAKALQADAIHIIYGHDGERVRERFASVQDLHWIEQTQCLGTGHAVLQAVPQLAVDGRTMVLVGDMPLVSLATLQSLLADTPQQGIGVVVAEVDNPSGLGRIIRDKKGAFAAIVEDKDCSEQQRQIKEVNSGIILVANDKLCEWLPKLSNDNAQKEYYLTEIIAMASAENYPTFTIKACSSVEIQGVNHRAQLATLERYYQQQQAQHYMLQGITLRDPARFDLRGELKAGQDVVIDINVLLEGKVSLGNNCHIGANCVLRNVAIADNVVIKENCVIEDATIASGCIVGPFARIRPGTELADEVHIGNFVELKNAKVNTQTKVNHLSYVGDAKLGRQVNIGAGTITCNYDGASKHVTEIGDNAFIGSNSQLIAPVKIGQGATIGAGSTIRKDAPPNALTVSITEERTLQDWQRPQKNSDKRDK